MLTDRSTIFYQFFKNVHLIVIYWFMNLQQKYNFEPKNVTFEGSKPTILACSIVIFDLGF
jgi:hypothetical protein